jgi:hypothetical protein
MRFSSIAVFTLASLALCAPSALPTDENSLDNPHKNEPSKNQPSKNEPSKNQPSKNESGKNQPKITILRKGTVKKGEHEKISTPPECNFEGSHAEFTYIQFKMGNSGNTACIGWESIYADCGNGAWSSQDYSNLISAVRHQTTEDGQFKHSKAGRWSAGFSLGTTAIPDRDSFAALFEYAVDFVGGEVKAKKWKTWFFSENKNYMTIVSGGC